MADFWGSLHNDDRFIAFVTPKWFKSPVADRIPLKTSLRLFDLEN